MRREHIIAIVFFASIYLGLVGLGNTHFWDDESYTAIMAKNLVEQGRYTTWDGRNLHLYINGAFSNSELISLGAPMDSYLIVPLFKLFGYSTWLGRIPFVVVGILALLVFLSLLKYDFGTENHMGLYSFVLLALSVSFLLNIRQCRYYALALFFGLLGFYAYRRFLENQETRFVALLSGSSILLFYTNYLIAGVFLLSLAALHLLLHVRKLDKSGWLKLILGIVFFLVGIIPQLRMALSVTDYGHHGEPWLSRHATILWWNIRDLNLSGMMPWTIALGLIVVLAMQVKRKELPPAVWDWLLFPILYVVIMGVVSPQSIEHPGIADLRYLFLITPFFMGLIGYFLSVVHQSSKVVSILLLVILLNTNLLSLLPVQQKFDSVLPVQQNFRLLLPSFLLEVHSPYTTSYEAVASFLRKEAKKDDIVFTLPLFTHGPLLFYTGGKVKFCCVLNKMTPLPKSTQQRLPSHVFVEESFPDWFIAFGRRRLAMRSIFRYLTRPHKEGKQMVSYEYRMHHVLNVYWKATHRPEVPWHQFSPNRRFDRRFDAVYIFKKVKRRILRPPSTRPVLRK